jgi:tetratricopeptide (TPR) repeat protein
MHLKAFTLALICASLFTVPLRAGESAQCIRVVQGSSSDVLLCPSSHPETAQQFFEIGIVHITQGAIAEAIEAWDHAIELDPHFIAAYVAKADWLIQQKEFGPALSLLEDAYQKLPRNSEIAYMLGKVHAQARRYQAAWNYFMVTLQQKPNHVLANFELGLMLESMDKPE